jgi:hypothetical protein
MSFSHYRLAKRPRAEPNEKFLSKIHDELGNNFALSVKLSVALDKKLAPVFGVR